MANFYKSNDVEIDFSEEEKEILKKASEILNDLGARLWQNDCDEEGVFFSCLGGCTQRRKGVHTKKQGCTKEGSTYR